MIEFIADKNGKISKLALYFCEDLSYSSVMKLLRNKDVKVNGKRVGQDLVLNVGDKVCLYYNQAKIEKYSVVFQDENVLVINKKSGYTSESVYLDIISKFSQGKFIHRLDRNTSGLMIFALNQIAENELLNGFKNRTFDKKYLATVYGIPTEKNKILTAYLLKNSEKGLVKIFDKKVVGSVEIKTGYKVIKTYDNSALLQITLYTGKTHQIRAHLAHIGHFILGDGKYGVNEINKKLGVKSQMLVASSLTLFFEKESPLFYLNGKSFSIEEL